jgi:hypothetical protein
VSVWFQVEETALHDRRIRLLAKRLGVTRGDAFYACCLVWCWLYKRGGDLLTAEEVDEVGELPGLGEAMALEGLADAVESGLRICGGKRARRYAAFRDLQKKRALDREAAKRAKRSDADNSAPLVPPNEHQVGSMSLSDPGSSRVRSPESLEVAQYLLTGIQAHTPGHVGNPERWAKDVDLAIRIDKRTPEELRRVVDFAHRNPDGAFWRANLLSGAKLRLHAPRLLIAMRNPSRGSVAGGNDGGQVMTADELAAWSAEQMRRERERGER